MKKINKIFSLSLLGIMFFSVFAIFFPQEINAADGCSRRCLPYATGMDITTLCATTSNETSAAYALLGLATPELLTDGVCTGQPSMTCPAGSIAACCCCSTCAYTAPAPPTPNTAQQYAQQQVNNWAQTQTISILPKYNNTPELQIKLPINFGKVNCENNDDGGFACSISWIGDYVAYVYRYGLSVAGILAAIVMMAGGVMWLTSGGDSGQVSKAKSFISGSVIGLLILFSTYMILYQINPGLTELNPITIGYKSTDRPVPGGSDSVFNATTQSCLNDTELFHVGDIDNIYIKPTCSDPRLSKTSYDALKKAAELAKAEGFKIQLNSANRTYEKQVELWDKEYKEQKAKNPTKTEAEIIKITGGIVAHPDKCKAPNCSGHCGGVAVDICLFGTSSCNKIGGRTNAVYKDAHTKKLEEIMNKAGWGRYCGEWWHFQTNLTATPCS